MSVPLAYSVPYLARCAALRHRGLSPDLMHDLQIAGNLAMLEQLEAVSDEDLAALSRLDEDRRAAAAAVAAAPGYVVWSKRSTGEVVAVAELGEPLVYGDREPLLWQDEADQA